MTSRRYRERSHRVTPLFRLFKACFDEYSPELLFRHKAFRLLQGEGLLGEERTAGLLSWAAIRDRWRATPSDVRSSVSENRTRVGACPRPV